jgi:hypothetical protein
VDALALVLEAGPVGAGAIAPAALLALLLLGDHRVTRAELLDERVEDIGTIIDQDDSGGSLFVEGPRLAEGREVHEVVDRCVGDGPLRLGIAVRRARDQGLETSG